MMTPAIDVYVAAFSARCAATRRPGQRAIDEPGVVGLLPSPEHPVVRLVVTDDRAYDVLAGCVPDARTGMITVLAAAARSTKLVRGLGSWTSDATTALIRRELRSVPDVSLPGALTCRPVRRLRGAPPDGVRLEDAVAAAMAADPRIDDAIAGYLRSLPASNRLFAAIDGDGVVRATSGSGTFGIAASVFFVNTDPDWRGRGIATAMTATALRHARSNGASHAALDATDAGLPIYVRLGFEIVGRATRFFRR
jgi:ribosomal protein S18 acetylase RimI-like enzyme